MAYKQAPQELIFESLGAIICLSVITPRQCAGSSLLWEPANAGHGVYNADPPSVKITLLKIWHTKIDKPTAV